MMRSKQGHGYLLVLIVTLAEFTTTLAWAPSPSSPSLNTGRRHFFERASFLQQSSAKTDADSTASQTTDATSLRIPISLDEMTRQVARAMSQAMATKGQRRQVARILLPRDASANDFGKYYEAEVTGESSSSTSSSSSAVVSTVLVPTDESWSGGVMQLYRAAAFTCQAILRQYAAIQTQNSGLPPRITEDRSLDESGVDGVGLFTTDDASVTVYLQPTQEVADDLVDRLAAAAASTSNNDDGITLLLNPQWRQVDDALDTASKGTGFLSNLANFLGGKGGTLQRLKDADFQAVYNLEGYVCRGSNIRLLQVLDSDWAVFCQRDENTEAFLQVGTLPSRPTYQQVEAMLDDSGISYKYSRDMGWEPKL